jgi:hypothetical protein
MTIPYGQDDVRLIRKEYRGKIFLDIRKYSGTGGTASQTQKGYIRDLETWKQFAQKINAELLGNG